MVRGAVHAHAYGLALKHLTGVGMTKMLPVPHVPGDKVPEARRFMQEGTHRRLYRFSPNDYAEIGAIWGNGEQGLPGEVVNGHPDGGKIPKLAGISAAVTSDYQPEEIFEIADKLYTAFKSCAEDAGGAIGQAKVAQCSMVLALQMRWKRPRSAEAAGLIRVDVLLPTLTPTAQKEELES
jgi:Manganese containing catalase